MTNLNCSRCHKSFYDKSHYQTHINRKIPCLISENNKVDATDLQCHKCGKIFSKPFSLKRHLNTVCKNKKSDNTIITDTNNGNINQFNIGNNNNLIIKQYNLLPFNKDGIDCLSTPDKIAIYSSAESAIEMIVIKINLDPKKINHHNVGYTDVHKGYGIIFDGDRWLTERIDVILEALLETKENDLKKIHDEIKIFLTDDSNNTIKNKLNDLNRILRPKNIFDVKSKKILIAHLKKHFYNNKHLVLDAKKFTDHLSSISDNKKSNNQIQLKEGFTIDDVDIGIKKNNSILSLKKDFALYILNQNNKISQIDHKSISQLISDTTDLKVISAITNLIIFSYFSDVNIDANSIQEKLEIEAYISDLYS